MPGLVKVKFKIMKSIGKQFFVAQGLKTEWIPKSQCFDPDNKMWVGNIVTVTMPNWLAKKKGLV
jgi:hypothetical protein